MPHNLMILTKLEAEEDRIKLLSMLSSIRWEKQHSKILQARQQDTATWIFDLDAFKRWKAESQSCNLYSHGIRKSLIFTLPKNVVSGIF